MESMAVVGQITSYCIYYNYSNSSWAFKVFPSASGRNLGIVPGSPVGFGAAPRAEGPAERARQTLGWGVVVLTGFIYGQTHG